MHANKLYINQCSITDTYYFIEKWALAYRHFDHKDTDTNMLVERYVDTYAYLYT